MHSLRELQRELARAILTGDAHRIERAIVAGDIAPHRRLRLHANNHREQLTRALLAIHPVVSRLVGEPFMRFAAARYVHVHPPRSSDLTHYGAAFPAFLSGFEPARDLPYLPDVARLERAWHESFHAAEAGSLDLSRLAGVAAAGHDAVRFRLHPAARLVDSPYPVLRIWEANRDPRTEPPTIHLDAGGERVLVNRPDAAVEVSALAAGEHALLCAFSRGLDLARACAAAARAEPRVDVTGCLRRHVLARTVTGFD